MIKRLLFAIISCLCFVMPVSANISIDADIVDAVVTATFGNNRAAALKEYDSAVAKNTDKTISAKDLWGVCAAGGWNIEQPDGKQNCSDFVYMLLKAASVEYYAVCGDGAGKGTSAGGTEECIREFSDVRVNMTPAVAIAQEYVRVKYKDDGLICSNDMRTARQRGAAIIGGKQDFLKCSSINNKAFYEFEFDTMDAYVDDNVHTGTVHAICMIHGVKMVDAVGVTGCDTADQSVCQAIGETARKFGYSAEMITGGAYTNTWCQINIDTVSKPEDLKNDFKTENIDNFYFCSNNIQIKNKPSFIDAITDYLSSHANIPASRVVCDSGFKTYTGAGCRTSWVNRTDDIVSCHVGDKHIDFVFDDINEWSNQRHKGGMSGITCLSSDGTFDGRNCRLLGEENCKILAKSVAQYCPECRAPEWNGTTCNMPDSASVDTLNKSLKIGAGIGAAAVGVVLFFVPGGQGGSLAILNWVAGTLVVGGAATRVTSNIIMQTQIFGPFADEAEACNNEECAKRILKESLKKISGYKKEFTDDEQKAVDALFNHLFAQIPVSSDFWYEFMSDSELFDPVTCEVKTTKQMWQKIRKWGEIAEIAGSLLRVVNIALPSTTQTITEKMGEKVYAFGLRGNGSKKGVLTVWEVATKEAGKTQTSKFLAGMGYKYGSQLTAEAAESVLKQAGLTSKMLQGAVFTDSARSSIRLAGGEIIDSIIKVPVESAGTVANVTLDMSKLVWNPAVGTLAETGISSAYYASASAPGYKIPICLQQKENYQGTITIIDIEEIDNNDGDGNIAPVDNLSVESELLDNVELVSNVNNNNSSVLPGIEYQSGSRPTTFVPKKTKNVGLIAAAAVLGTVGTGALIGGLVVSNNKKTSGTTATPIQTDAQLDTVMANARGTLGFMGNKPVTLVSLPTVMNKATAPIVLVDGRAVVVVSYDGHKLPFYLDENKWEPLLGIGPKGHWFNVYPEKIGISKIEKLANLLNDKLLPVVVAKYVTQNVSGVSFPTADKSAFEIINSEFPNGVVESVYMSNADKQLYNDNYLLVRQSLL